MYLLWLYRRLLKLVAPDLLAAVDLIRARAGTPDERSGDRKALWAINSGNCLLVAVALYPVLGHFVH